MMLDEEAVRAVCKIGIELQDSWLLAEQDAEQRSLQRLLRVDEPIDGGDCRQTRADEKGE